MLSFAAVAEEVAVLPPGGSYQEAKTWHEHFMQGNPTKAQRLAAMRSLILASPVQSRGLSQIYHNFEGRYSIDPSIPGLERSVLAQLSASRQQAKGYRREVLYAVAYYNDPRFSVVEMNRPLKRSWGNTDADLVIRHRPTGLIGRVEVKDYSLSSQHSNLRKLKIQIDKMALDGNKTGQLQFWMNARPVIPEVREYAERAGVHVTGNVKTGKTIAPGSIPIREAMNQHEQQFFRVDAGRRSIGAGELVFGAWKLKQSLPKAIADLRSVMDQDSSSTSSWLRFGESSSSLIAGSSMVVSGSSWASTRFASESLQPRLFQIGKVGGATAILALAASETFQVARYIRGDVLSQEFWTGQWVTTSTTAGGFGGWVVGYFIGKAPPAAFVGANAGAFLGSEFGTRTADMYYEQKYREIDVALGRNIYAQYNIR